MRKLALEQTADYLENSQIEKSINEGFTNVHIGTNPAGSKFILVNDGFGDVVVSESM